MDENKNKETGSFVGFILLNEPTIDLNLLKKDIENDWNILIDSKELNEKEDSIVANIENLTVAISLVKAPIPNDEASENAKTNYSWQDAVKVAQDHKAHLIVAVLRGQNSLVDAATLYVKICSSSLRQPNATGINTSGCVYQPKAYIDLAKSYIENGDIPILNLIYFGIYSNDNGKTISAYTYGLRIFGKYDIEIIDSNHTTEEVFNFLHNIIDYILESNVELKDGETIGFTAEQKLPITLSSSDILGIETLKIRY